MTFHNVPPWLGEHRQHYNSLEQTNKSLRKVRPHRLRSQAIQLRLRSCWALQAVGVGAPQRANAPSAQSSVWHVLDRFGHQNYLCRKIKEIPFILKNEHFYLYALSISTILLVVQLPGSARLVTKVHMVEANTNRYASSGYNPAYL